MAAVALAVVVFLAAVVLAVVVLADVALAAVALAVVVFLAAVVLTAVVLEVVDFFTLEPDLLVFFFASPSLSERSLNVSFLLLEAEREAGAFFTGAFFTGGFFTVGFLSISLSCVMTVFSSSFNISSVSVIGSTGVITSLLVSSTVNTVRFFLKNKNPFCFVSTSLTESWFKVFNSNAFASFSFKRIYSTSFCFKGSTLPTN